MELRSVLRELSYIKRAISRNVSRGELNRESQTRELTQRYKEGKRAHTWSEFDWEWVSCLDNRVTNSESWRIFVALNWGGVTFELNDFTDELVPTNLDKFVHFGAAHIFCNDKGASNLVDTSVLGGLIIVICVSHCFSFLPLKKFLISFWLIDYLSYSPS
jgi:hypothetical protein